MITDEKLTIHQALLKAQSEYGTVGKTETNPFFKSKYADLPAILEVVLPKLNENGLFLVQHPINEGDRVGVKTQIIYQDGEMIESAFTVKLAKDDPQGAGSAITYCRRYALVSILGLNVDKDDDGNMASGNEATYINKVIAKSSTGISPETEALTTKDIRR